MPSLVEFEGGYIDSRALEIALTKFMESKGESFPEDYKKKGLDNLNSELGGKDITKSDISEIFELLKDGNPSEGSFCDWSELRPVKNFVDENPEAAAESLNYLIRSDDSLKERISTFREDVNGYSDKYNLNGPGTAYILAAFNSEEFVPYNSDAYTTFVSWFSNNYGVTGHVEDKIVNYFSLCRTIKDFYEFDNLLEAQDLLYSVTKYDEFVDKIPLLYLWNFTQKWSEFSEDADLFLSEIEDLPDNYLKSRRDHYSDDRENVNEIRFRLLDKLIGDGSVSAEDLEGIKQDVNSRSDTNITNSWDNFSILGQIYIDFFNNLKKTGDHGVWNYLSQKLKEKIDYENSRSHIVDYAGAQHFMDLEPWIALYPDNYNSHREAPQVFLQFQPDQIRYGLTIGDKYADQSLESSYDSIGDSSNISLGKIVERLKQVKNEIEDLEDEENRTVWIEKSYVKSNDHRLKGDRKVGKALWCPQNQKNGHNSMYYSNLTEAEPGDIVLHLDQDGREFIGLSRVKEAYRESTVLEETDWDEVGINEMDYDRGERPCYLVELEDYQELDETLGIDKAFNERYSEILDKVKENNKGLVYTKDYELNQGAYLTKTPTDLLRLIQDVYKKEKGKKIPFLKERDSIVVDKAHLEPEKDLSADLELDFNDLYFPDDEAESIKSQIKASLNSGKNIIFTGPPGTGKTEIAEAVASELEKKDENINGSELTTATSDWSTFDTVGGFMPDKNGGGDLKFNPGQVLKRFKDSENNQNNELLVIDEINRADIDKAFGQLFTVLSGQRVQLPFTAENDKEIEVLPGNHKKASSDPAAHQYIIPESWRIMATMNTYDKTSLYEMSYAFMRRFSFIRVEAPIIPDEEDSRKELMKGYLDAWEMEDIQAEDEEVEITTKIWKQVNSADVDREIGPAIAQDMLKFLKESGTNAESNTAAITNYIFPQLEGVPERKKIVKSISEADVDLDDERLSRTARKMLQVDISGAE